MVSRGAVPSPYPGHSRTATPDLESLDLRTILANQVSSHAAISSGQPGSPMPPDLRNTTATCTLAAPHGNRLGIANDTSRPVGKDAATGEAGSRPVPEPSPPQDAPQGSMPGQQFLGATGDSTELAQAGLRNSMPREHTTGATLHAGEALLPAIRPSEEHDIHSSDPRLTQSMHGIPCEETQLPAEDVAQPDIGEGQQTGTVRRLARMFEAGNPGDQHPVLRTISMPAWQGVTRRESSMDVWLDFANVRRERRRGVPTNHGLWHGIGTDRAGPDCEPLETEHSGEDTREDGSEGSEQGSDSDEDRWGVSSHHGEDNGWESEKEDSLAKSSPTAAATSGLAHFNKPALGPTLPQGHASPRKERCPPIAVPSTGHAMRAGTSVDLAHVRENVQCGVGGALSPTILSPTARRAANMPDSFDSAPLLGSSGTSVFGPPSLGPGPERNSSDFKAGFFGPAASSSDVVVSPLKAAGPRKSLLSLSRAATAPPSGSSLSLADDNMEVYTGHFCLAIPGPSPLCALITAALQ